MVTSAHSTQSKKKMIASPVRHSVMEAVERDLKTKVKEINVSAPISGNLIERLKQTRTAAQDKIAKAASHHDNAVGKLNTAADRVDAEAQAVENEANAIIAAFGNEE